MKLILLNWKKKYYIRSSRGQRLVSKQKIESYLFLLNNDKKWKTDKWFATSVVGDNKYFRWIIRQRHNMNK